MTSKDNGGNDPSPPDRAGNVMDLLIGWRAGGTEAAGEPAAERNAEEAAEPGAEAVSVPAPDPAVATTAELAAGQQRILGLLEQLAPKQAEATTGEAGTDLQEAAAAIQAATEWVSDIRAAIETVLAATGKSIQNLNAAEQGLGEEAAALKTRAGEIDGQVEALRSGARVLGTRLRQLDEARQNLDARSAELQAVKQEIAKYYGEWTAAALTYRREMAGLTKRLDEGETLAARVEQSIDPWTERIEKSLDESAKAQKRAAAETSGNVERLTQGGDAFLDKFGTAYSEALEGFRAEWRRTRRWTVPVLASALILALPGFTAVGAFGQSQFGIFKPYDDTDGWKQAVWDYQGEDVKRCLMRASKSPTPVMCNFEVDWP